VEEKPKVAAGVNRSYWDSDESVAEISNRFGVSRRALYEMVEPAPAGIECTECGAELYYANRSAKAANLARCLMCGHEAEVNGEISYDDVGAVPPSSVRRATKPATGYVMRDRAASIAGFAIAGVVVGAIVTILVRRNR